MKYIAHLFQEGGCDYTIGCGHAIREFEADNIEAAREEVKEIADEYSRDYINEITLYEIASEESIDIDDLFAEDDAAAAVEAQAKKEKEEKELLQALKNKYPEA